MILKLKKMFGLIGFREYCEQAHIVDEAKLIKAIKDKPTPAEKWEYLLSLIYSDKLSERFVIKNSHLFGLQWLIKNNYYSISELTDKNTLPSERLGGIQLEELPMSFKIKHRTYFNLMQFNIPLSDRTVLSFETREALNWQKEKSTLEKLIIKSGTSVFNAPINKTTLFQIKKGHLYFDSDTHDFDINLTQDDMNEMEPLLELIYEKVSVNTKEMKMAPNDNRTTFL